MTVSFKPTTDARLLLRLDGDIFPSDEPIDVLDEDTYWWAQEGVGFAGIKYLGSGVFFLARAGLMPSWRGRGLHKRLIRVRERFVRRIPIDFEKWVITYTDISNVASANSLIACGYRTYIPENPWVGTDVNYWRKML